MVSGRKAPGESRLPDPVRDHFNPDNGQCGQL